MDYVDKILRPHGSFQAPPYGLLTEIPHEHIRQWCARNGYFLLPTLELQRWLRSQIGSQPAVEICAGHGDLCRGMSNVISTDSYIQTEPEVVAYCQSLGIVPVSPSADVLRYEALQAIDQFKPRIVIGAGVPPLGAMSRGVNESLLLEKVEKYILIGNRDDREIAKIPHETFRFKWLVTQAVEQQRNFIKIWKGNNANQDCRGDQGIGY